jgi:hypothetical protein
MATLVVTPTMRSDILSKLPPYTRLLIVVVPVVPPPITILMLEAAAVYSTPLTTVMVLPSSQMRLLDNVLVQPTMRSIPSERMLSTTDSVNAMMSDVANNKCIGVFEEAVVLVTLIVERVVEKYKLDALPKLSTTPREVLVLMASHCILVSSNTIETFFDTPLNRNRAVVTKCNEALPLHVTDTLMMSLKA